MNTCEHLTKTAKLFPAKEALVFEGHRFTYAELDALSRSAARQLKESGVECGDRVAIVLPNVPAFVVWYYAALRVGAIAVSISTRLAASEVAFLVEDCQARCLIALPESLAQIGETLPDCASHQFAVDPLNGQTSAPVIADSLINTDHDADPDDAALILYTSGTTGFAKGATLTHMNVRSNVHAFNHLCNMQPADRILLAVPLFHCFGQNALLNAALNVGATLVLQRKFDPAESKRLIADEQVTQLYGVPMMFQLFHDSCLPSDLASVTYCFSAAATLPIQTSRRWQEKFGMPIHEGYGLTETSPFASYNHRLEFKPGSIGTPIDCVEMRIVDTETGVTCPPGELGEIAIRGPNVMQGYWNRPEDTARAIRDGWFHSGDIGRQDENGFFYIVDRVKDMISVGGLKVFPAEVERVLLDHPLVSQAAVIGVPGPVLGEQVIGYLVLTPNIAGAESDSNIAVRTNSNDDNDNDSANNESDQIREILQHAKSNLGDYKIPRRLIAIAKLPRNPSGKILKTKLREMAADPNNAAPPEGLYQLTSELPDGDLSTDQHTGKAGIQHELRPATLRKQLVATFPTERPRVIIEYLQNHIQTVCELDKPPHPDSTFIDAGMDSLAIVGLSAQLQTEIGPQQTLPPTLLFDYARIDELAGFLDEQMGEPIAEQPLSLTAQTIATKPETLNPSVNNRTAQSGDLTSAVPPPKNQHATQLRATVQQMSEEEALAELMKELD